MSTILSFAAVTMIFIAASTVVLNVADGVISSGTSTAKIRDTENLMKTLDSAIKQVVLEGSGAKRQVSIKSQAIIDIIPQENSLVAEIETKGLTDYFSVTTEGNVKKISGSDVDCIDSGDLVMENSLIKATFARIGSQASHAVLNTSRIFKSVLIKPATNMTIADSAIEIDGSVLSINGTGYTEILNPGSSLSSCSVHLYMNGTYEYDGYYTLYAGTDFLVFEARNVGKK
ncbi:MAG: hypothetical protein HY364_02425 [Candidatus Aenigmarchaeota archaeon]|nr:hypothetical protein [Candidatus Aenigmarchaeota archaeon]